MSLFIIMNAMMKQPQSLTKTSNPALIRRRRERSHPHAHPYHVDVDTLESSIFPPRRCNFARRAPGSSHRIRHNIQDVQQTGLPLCDVVLFQNAGIPSPLACKPASLSLSQLKAGSRAPSSHSPATPACSIRSRSARAGMKDTYEARTWRNRLRRHSVRSNPVPVRPKTYLLIRNRDLPEHSSQVHVARPASQKKLPSGAKVPLDHTPCATYVASSTPNVKPECDPSWFKGNLTDSLTSFKRVSIVSPYVHYLLTNSAVLSLSDNDMAPSIKHEGRAEGPIYYYYSPVHVYVSMDKNKTSIVQYQDSKS
ncbi:unnamed protein product [Fusarium graminearum]|nr:unnamed protein product [Fusarium graminearum]